MLTNLSMHHVLFRLVPTPMYKVLLTVFALACALMAVSAAFDEPAFDQAFGTIATDGQFSFAGRVNTTTALNSSTIVFSLTPADQTFPMDVAIQKVVIQFRKHHCNCFINQFVIQGDGTAAIVNQVLTFSDPIEDHEMNFQATATYIDAEGKLAIQDYPFTIVMEFTDKSVHTAEFSIAYREPVAHVFSASFPRHSFPNDASEAVPGFPQILLNSFNITAFAVLQEAPRYMKAINTGRFQFDVTDKKTYKCFVNSREVSAVIKGETYNSYLLIDIAPITPYTYDNSFVAFHCEEALALYPTNAVTQFKFDQSFISFDFLSEDQTVLGLGVVASLKNLPDETGLFTGSGYIDEDILYCDFTASYNNSHSFTGKEKLSVYYNGIEGNFTGVKARLDVVPTNYVEKEARAIPMEFPLVNYKLEDNGFNGVGFESVDIKSTKFVNNANGTLSFKSFIDLTNSTTVIPDTFNIQCVAIFNHTNTHPQFKGQSYMYYAASPVRYTKFSDEVTVSTDLKKTDTTFVVSINNLQAEGLSSFSFNLPMANFIFTGNYATCKVGVLDQAANTTVYTPLPGYGSTHEQTGKSETINFPITEDVTVFVKGAHFTIECPDALMTQKNPQYEFVHKSTVFHVQGKTKASEITSSSAILPLQQSTKTLYIIYGIFLAIMSIALVIMLICVFRCTVATCQKKNNQNDRQTLLLNSGSYNLD